MLILKKIIKIFLAIKNTIILNILLLKGIKVHKTTKFRYMPFLKLNGKFLNVLL